MRIPISGFVGKYVSGGCLGCIVILGACGPSDPDPASLAGCYDLAWYREGALQVGPLLPQRIGLRLDPADPVVPESGLWWTVEPVDGPDGGVPDLSWEETYRDRAWQPLGPARLRLVLGLSQGSRWEVDLQVQGDSVDGVGWYVSGSDSTRLELIGAEMACPQSG